ncbi:MAG: tRNA (N6-threonylcarbamoyladenosine(37)-N6)-methyltransferase TrmO, partial [Hyphomicrobiaceae bacterium]
GVIAVLGTSHNGMGRITMSDKQEEGAVPEGEVWLEDDPAASAADAHLVFVGQVASGWTAAAPPPKNPNEARERKAPAHIAIDAPYRPALQGLSKYSHVIVLVWLHRSSRRPLVIRRQRHFDSPRGVFGVRSPVRPNPIGLSVCRILAVDEKEGRIDVDAIDFLEGTPVIDIKPYRPGVDAFPDAVIG